MKIIFYATIFVLILFEIANVYFIMPMPGSQEMNSIDLAYFLYSWRWLFRIALYLFIIFSFSYALKASKWLSVLGLLLAVGVSYAFNFQMKADHVFLQPEELIFKNATENKVPKDRVIIGVSIDQEAKAYPISYIGYHHQIPDTLAGKSIMITYCTVCRTARVFEPDVDGKPERFRLVGMDHYNAMFEDQTTKSWWRQENGEAIAGKLKGHFLKEINSQQASLDTWLMMHPSSLIMQEDPKSVESYDSLAKFELGKSKSRLTKRDSLSWNDKSWIVGIQSGTNSIAIDWNDLIKKRQINFKLDTTPMVLMIASDNKSFFAFKGPPNDPKLLIFHDTIYSKDAMFNLNGENISNKDSIPNLKQITAYQEFWQSWKMFHPGTKKLKV